MRTATAMFRMADRLADGRLAEVITELKASGLSAEAISRKLYVDFGIEVTRQTVANWAAAIEADAAAAEAQAS